MIHWRRVVLPIALGASLASASPAVAQNPAAPPPLPSDTPVVVPPIPGMLVGGVVGGAVGLGLGAVSGLLLERALTRSCYDYCGLHGFFVGGLIGESVGLALGLHLANSRQRPFALSSLLSLGIAAAGIAFAANAGIDAGALSVVVPVTQLLVVVGVEARR